MPSEPLSLEVSRHHPGQQGVALGQEPQEVQQVVGLRSDRCRREAPSPNVCQEGVGHLEIGPGRDLTVARSQSVALGAVLKT